MAKKRGGVSPLGNSFGSQEALKESAKQEIGYIAQQLKEKADLLETPISDVLAAHLGIHSVGKSRVWTLKSGKKATFTEVTLTHEQVKNNTTVTFTVNGRDQSTLTKESLKDLDTLEQQQFYPAIGRRVAGKIDLLDGSRRRARFLLAGGAIKEFKMLVTDDDVSVSDAKALAASLQVAKEHNLREVGLRLQQLIEEHQIESETKLTQTELAKLSGLSQAKVSKALKAASINEALIRLFPDINELVNNDYNVLASLQSVIGEDSLSDFIESIQFKIDDSETSSEEYKDQILKLLKSNASELQEKKERPVVSELAKFDSKDKFARKKVVDRKYVYEFNRLPQATQNRIDEAIRHILEES
ncbi:chromosome partitioning protein ParB [bacterium]|jgi:ParB family chromosome partitioning protein|nr:chromosome partitioning protein ParB [bacterium]